MLLLSKSRSHVSSIFTSVLGPLLVGVAIRFWSFWLQAPCLPCLRFLRFAACLIVTPDGQLNVFVKLKEREGHHISTLWSLQESDDVEQVIFALFSLSELVYLVPVSIEDQQTGIISGLASL